MGRKLLKRTYPMGKSPGESSSNKIINLQRFSCDRTHQPDHSYHNNDFPFNQNSPARSVKSGIVCTKEMVFQKKTLWKKPFLFWAMVWSAISDKWKAPLDEQGVALSKKNVRAACPKCKLEFKIFSALQRT